MAERVAAPQVKICGLTRFEDAAAAAEAGAHYGGVILAPGGRRSIDAERALAVFAGLPLRRVGVLVDAAPDEAAELARRVRLDVVQLHGDETPEQADQLRRMGSWAVWKAVRPRNGDQFAEYVNLYASSVDGLLLDGWAPDARGGTGARFPWAEVAALRDLLPAELPLIAAGGLRPDNVARAVGLLRPSVVDVSSGVEAAPGLKDAARIRAFVAGAATPLESLDPSPHD